MLTANTLLLLSFSAHLIHASASSEPSRPDPRRSPDRLMDQPASRSARHQKVAASALPQHEGAVSVWLPTSRSGEPSASASIFKRQAQAQAQQEQQQQRMYYANEELVRQQPHIVARRPPAPPPPLAAHMPAQAPLSRQTSGSGAGAGGGSSAREAAQLIQASAYSASANSHLLHDAHHEQQLTAAAAPEHWYVGGGSNLSLDRRARSVKAVKQMQLLNRMASRPDENEEAANALQRERAPLPHAATQQQTAAAAANGNGMQIYLVAAPIGGQKQVPVRRSNGGGGEPGGAAPASSVVASSGHRVSQHRMVPVPVPSVPPYHYAPPSTNARPNGAADADVEGVLFAAEARMSRANPQLRESMLNVQLSPPSMIPRALAPGASNPAPRPLSRPKKASLADRYAGGPVQDIDSVYGTWRRTSNAAAAVKHQLPPSASASAANYCSSASLLDMHRAAASGRPQSASRKTGAPAPGAEELQANGSGSGGLSRFFQSASDLLRRSARSLSRNRSRSRSKSPATYSAYNAQPPNPSAPTVSNGQSYATGTVGTTGASQSAGHVSLVAVKSSGRAARARPNGAPTETTVALNGTLQRSTGTASTRAAAAAPAAATGEAGEQPFRRQKSISERIGGFFRSINRSHSRSRSRGRSRSPNSQRADGDVDEDEDVPRERSALPSETVASSSSAAAQHRSRHTDFASTSPPGEPGLSRDIWATQRQGAGQSERAPIAQAVPQYPYSHPYLCHSAQLHAPAPAPSSSAQPAVQLVRSNSKTVAPFTAPATAPPPSQTLSPSAAAATTWANSFDVSPSATQQQQEEPERRPAAFATRAAPKASVRPRTTPPAPPSYEPSVNIKLVPFPMMHMQTSLVEAPERADAGPSSSSGIGTKASSSSSSSRSGVGLPNGGGAEKSSTRMQSARQRIARPTPLHAAPTPPPEVPRSSLLKTGAAAALIGRRDQPDGAIIDSESRHSLGSFLTRLLFSPGSLNTLTCNSYMDERVVCSCL